MKVPELHFSPGGRFMWGALAATVLLQLTVLGYFGWRWHNITVDGIPYQWQCVPRLEVSSFGTDYIRVVFPQDTAEWMEPAEPEEGQTIYVQISRDDKGLMEIKGAAASKPLLGGDYMEAKAVSYQDGQVQFQVGFNRYRMTPDKMDGIYNLAAGDSVLASIRMKKGLGVIEGIFVNGIPLESISNGAAIEAARAARQGNEETKTPGRTRIVESGMVPPKEE